MINQLWKGQLHPRVAVLLISQLVFAVVVLLESFGYLEPFELLAYDQGVRWRAETAARDPRIAIITVTEEDLGRYRWPLSDEVFAETLDRVIGQGPIAIAVDWYREYPIEPGGDRLADLLARSRNIIWVYRLGDGQSPGTPPPAVLRGTDRKGFGEMVIDRDSVVRRAFLFDESGAELGVSMPLRMAESFLEPRGLTRSADPQRPALMRLGHATFERLDDPQALESGVGGYHDLDAGGYQFLLDYVLGNHPFEQYSLTTVLDGQLPPGTFSGRLVFFGAAAETVKDSFDTPFSSVSDVNGGTFGVVLHGLVTNQLLRNALGETPLTTTLDRVSQWACLWLWCLLGAVWGRFATSTVRFTIGTAAGIVALGALWQVAFLHYVWVPLVPSVLGWIGSAALLLAYTTRREQQEREAVMRLFSSYVSDTIAREIWRQRDVFLAGNRPRPQRLTATVLFSEMEDFTPFSEPLEAQEVVDWLNAYMDVMVKAAIQHDGTIIQFTSNGILTAFGVPLPHLTEADIDADAARAVDCALEISRQLERLNHVSRARGLPQIEIRIGINTGPLVAGSLGCAERLEYTVVGDTVNVAERLKAFAKELSKLTGIDNPCRIAVGTTTWHRLKERYFGYPVGAVSLKGKEQRVEVYQVIGHETNQKPEPTRSGGSR